MKYCNLCSSEAGALLVPILGLVEVGGWKGMVSRIHQNIPHGDYTHMWSTLGHFNDNPMGNQWIGIVFGVRVCYFIWILDYRFFGSAAGIISEGLTIGKNGPYYWFRI